MKAYLKIKVTSLAAEARLIRKEERKYLKAARKTERYNVQKHSLAGDPGDYPAVDLRQTYHGLREHRIRDVRRESRSAQLAYGYLKGKRYLDIENKVLPGNEPEWGRVRALVIKYGSKKQVESFDNWKSESDVIQILTTEPCRPIKFVPTSVIEERKQKKKTFLEKIKNKLGLQK